MLEEQPCRCAHSILTTFLLTVIFDLAIAIEIGVVLSSFYETDERPLIIRNWWIYYQIKMERSPSKRKP